MKPEWLRDPELPVPVSVIKYLAAYYEIVTFGPEEHKFRYSDKIFELKGDKDVNRSWRYHIDMHIKAFGTPKTHFEWKRVQTIAFIRTWLPL